MGEEEERLLKGTPGELAQRVEVAAAKPDKLSLIPRTHKLLGRKEPVLASCSLASIASSLTSPSQAHMHKISKCGF